ncbi:Uncharacterised protein [uncultured archaeon]|nr:Uncharacterised protein [uncultured archaeon]
MKIQLVLLGITLMLIVVGCTGCNMITVKETHSKFYGTWEAVNEKEGDRFYHSITFYDNGLVNLRYKKADGTYSNSTGTWTYNTTTAKLSFNLTSLGRPNKTFHVAFQQQNDLMLLEDYLGGIGYQRKP